MSTISQINNQSNNETKNDKTMVKVVKVELGKIENVNIEIFNVIANQLMKESIEIKNKVIELSWEWSNFSSGYTKNNKPKPKEILLKNDNSTTYNTLKGYINNIVSTGKFSNTGNISTIVNDAEGKFKKYEKDMFVYNLTADFTKKRPNLPRFKTPEIVLHDKSIRLSLDENNNYKCDISLLGTKGEKLNDFNLLIKRKLDDVRIDEEIRSEMRRMRKNGETIIKNVTYERIKNKTKPLTDEELLQQDNLITKGSITATLKLSDTFDNKSIIDRILIGEYKLGASKIVKLKNNKYMLYLTYKFKPQAKEYDMNNILGVDLGINTPVYMAVHNTKKRIFISGNEIRAFRKKTEALKKSLQHQAAYCGEGRVGHGRKTRLKPVYKIKDKINRFTTTKNHVYSKRVIEIAKKYNCGVIQMEDLSGIAEGEKKSTFLGDWTYYQLGEMIIYKAEEAGIKVVFVKPRYTSARCNKCGHIHRSKDKKDTLEKEGWRNKTEQFKCQNCDYGHKYFVHADYNAALNIATPNIEEIIKNQMKVQGISEKDY